MTRLPENQPRYETEPNSLTTSIELRLDPKDIQYCSQFYFSEKDPIHQHRRHALKQQTFANPDELAACLLDDRVPKIVVRHQNKIAGALMASQPSTVLQHYSPSHLLRVESDGTMPFFHGGLGWPSHYQILSSLPNESLTQYSKFIMRQAEGLNIILPPFTQLDPITSKEAQSYIDNKQLWICIDAIIHDGYPPTLIHQEILKGLRNLNRNRPGLLLHHYPHTEISHPTSLAKLNTFDTIDAQAYWQLDISPKSLPTPSPESTVPLHLRHVNQKNLSNMERKQLVEQLHLIEHTACGIDTYAGQTLDKINKLPYPILIAVDQEYTKEAFHHILSTDPNEIGLYVFEENNLKIHGYFVVITPQGSQLPLVQAEIMSENPHVPPQDTSYVRIAALVSDPYAQSILKSNIYRLWFSQVMSDYLPEGGSVVSDTDAFLGNLRLIHLLLNGQDPKNANVNIEIQLNDLVKF